MNKTVTHDFEEETIESKARWFQSLSLSERMDLFCDFAELALSLNPELVEKKDAQPPKGRVQIVPKT